MKRILADVLLRNSEHAHALQYPKVMTRLILQGFFFGLLCSSGGTHHVIMISSSVIKSRNSISGKQWIGSGPNACGKWQGESVTSLI